MYICAMTQNVTVTPDQKVEISLLQWASDNQKLRELWVYLYLRWEARDTSGYIYKTSKPAGISGRHYHRVLKSLAEDLGWVTLSRKSIKVVSLSKVLQSGTGNEPLTGRACVRIPCYQSFEEFKATLFAVEITRLVKRQKYLMKTDPYYHELLKKGVVKRGQVSVSVMSEKLGVSKSTAHRWKHICRKLNLLTILPEYIQFLSEEEALLKRAEGFPNIMRVTTPKGGYAWVLRNTDIIIPHIIFCKRWNEPSKAPTHRPGYEPHKKEYVRRIETKSKIEQAYANGVDMDNSSHLSAFGFSCELKKKRKSVKPQIKLPVGDDDWASSLPY